VGEGTHERFVINVPRFRAKFNEKQRKLASSNASKSIKDA
jgi:hypothetical protein